MPRWRESAEMEIEWKPTLIPASTPQESFLITDKMCARRLRDRVAREIAAIVYASGSEADCSHLIPVYRWLSDLAEDDAQVAYSPANAGFADHDNHAKIGEWGELVDWGKR